MIALILSLPNIVLKTLESSIETLPRREWTGEGRSKPKVEPSHPAPTSPGPVSVKVDGTCPLAVAVSLSGEAAGGLMMMQTGGSYSQICDEPFERTWTVKYILYLSTGLIGNE
jgi:hypothetical protein